MFKLAAAFAGVIATTQALDVYANNRVFAYDDDEDDELPEKVEFAFPDISAHFDQTPPEITNFNIGPVQDVAHHDVHSDVIPKELTGHSSTPAPHVETHHKPAGFTTRQERRAARRSARFARRNNRRRLRAQRRAARAGVRSHSVSHDAGHHH